MKKIKNDKKTKLSIDTRGTKPLNGNVIIKIKALMDNMTESGLYKDITFDVHGKMMIRAEVVAVPRKGSNEVMLEINNGEPRSREVEPVYVRNREVKHDVRVGDMIYFHYLTLEDPSNYLFMEDGFQIYRVPIHDIFSSMREDKNGSYVRKGVLYTANMHNQYVFGKEYWGEGWEEIEVGEGGNVAVKLSPSGLITETKGDPIPDRAVIADIGKGIPPYSRFKEISSGDAVVLKPNSEFENLIDNQKRWVFTHEDIVAKIGKDGTIIPVCDYLLIKLKERSYKGKIEVNKDYLNLESEGEIVSSGINVDSDLFKKFTEVKFFSKGSIVVMDKTHALVREGNILGLISYAL